MTDAIRHLEAHRHLEADNSCYPSRTRARKGEPETGASKCLCASSGFKDDLADLFHDACVIADRDHSPIETALDGAAISHGFASWMDAETKLNNTIESQS